MATMAEVVRPHYTLWSYALIRLRRNRLAVAGGIVILIVVLGAVFAPFITAYAFDQQNLNAILEGPSSAHLFGTDELGRDVFSRLLYGARTSLAVGIFTQLIVLIIGLPIGAFSGYAGGRIDNIMMRFVDVMYAFPDILLIILLRAVLGGSIYMIFLAIGLVAWVNIARLVRGQILSLKQRDFITAARAMGGTSRYITLRHLLPNSLGPVIVAVTFNVPRAIFAEAALSYIGIGVKPPTPSWGELLHQAQQFRWAWWLILYPSLALFVVMLLGIFVGEGVRDAFDPHPYIKME